MGEGKIELSVTVYADQMSWLKQMAEQFDLEDEHKALRVVLDFAMHEADHDEVFTEMRCHHCA